MLIFEEFVSEGDVDQGILDVLVPQDSLHVENIFGAVVFHGAFPMAKGFEGDLQDSWVFQFVGESFSLATKLAAVEVQTHSSCGEHFFVAGSRHHR